MHRILYVNPTAIHGGAEESLLVMMNAIRDQAIEPVLIVPNQGWLTQRCSEIGIPFEVLYGLPNPLAINTFSSQARIWIPNALAIARFARRHRAVLIHANTPRTAYQAGLGARLARLPCIVHVHDADPEFLPYSKLRHRLVLTLLSDHFIAVSAATAEVLRTLLPGLHPRISVVYNGMPKQFYEDACQTDIRAELRLPSDTLLIGSISALSPWKGQDVLIRAFPAVHTRFPQARLLIVGGSQGAASQEQFAAYLRTLVAELGLNDVVHFTGWREDVVSIMRALDLFVHAPTRLDPLPTVVIHACAVGCLIVAARIGGIPEIVEDGISGLLVPPRDSAALSVAIIQALANRERLAPMRHNARQRFLQRFSVPQMIDGLLEVYKRWVPGLNSM